MSRWLAALKKHERGPEPNRQNRQNPRLDSSVSFVSPDIGVRANFPEPTPVSEDGFLSVLSVPVWGQNENSSAPDPDGMKASFAERAAILEYDAGLPRTEAERLAAIGDDPAPKPDAEMYADALRICGPCGYGPVAVFLGWGATRAANAEAELRAANRISYDRTGRGQLIKQEFGRRAWMEAPGLNPDDAA